MDDHGNEIEIRDEVPIPYSIDLVANEDAPIQVQVVPDLQVPLVREKHDGSGSYTRSSIANAQLLYYIAENDRDGGVGMDEMMREFSMGVMMQGRVALSMKDSCELGYAKQVAPRGDPYRWRITEAGLEALGLERVLVSPPPDPEALKQWVIDQHGRTNLTLLRAEMEAEAARRAAEGKEFPGIRHGLPPGEGD